MRCLLVLLIVFASLAAGQLVYASDLTLPNTATAEAGSAKIPVDESRLWLPKSYKVKHSLPLLRAAAAALAMPRCHEIKQGTLDLSQSTHERPVYIFVCLQANGQTYAEVVDGTSFNSMVHEVTPAPECHQRLMEQVNLMHELAWHPSSPLPEGAQLAVWDFDAKNPEGVDLHYRAVCTLDKHKKASVKILPRRP